MSILKAVRLFICAMAFVVWSSSTASAATIIGFFTWELDAFGVDYTFGLQASADWPTALVLDNVHVDFELDDATTGEAFFDGTGPISVGVTATTMTVTPPLLVPGIGLDPVPQNVVEAFLRFTFDPALGTVSVTPLGQPAFLDSREILFEAAPTAVPEPSTLLLVGTLLSGAAARRLRRRS